MAPETARVVSRDPGPQTMTGAGDIVADQYGNRYRVIDMGEAMRLRSSTGESVYTLHNDGTIR